MLIGTLFALAAGLMWGLVFIAPTLLPAYPAVLLSCARYLAFGLIALPLAWLDRARIAELTPADWREAFKLSAIGNLLYYLCLAAAIQRAGGPLPTMIIGTLPVVIAVVSNLRDVQRDGRLPWLRLLPSLLLIAAGIGCVNQVEIAALRADPQADLVRGPKQKAILTDVRKQLEEAGEASERVAETRATRGSTGPLRQIAEASRKGDQHIRMLLKEGAS